MVRIETPLDITEHVKVTISTICSMISDKDLVVTIKEQKKKRSLDSNAYFHVLCEKLRTVLKISFAECKNDMITSFGQAWTIDEETWIYKTNAPPEFIKEREEIHLKFIKLGEDNETYFYKVYRGSHTYNSSEMAQLIEGTVRECQLHGIETLTPVELERMNEMWGKKHGI